VRGGEAEVGRAGAGGRRDVEQFFRAREALGEEPHHGAAFRLAADVVGGIVVVDKVSAVLLYGAGRAGLAKLEDVQLVGLVVSRLGQD